MHSVLPAYFIIMLVFLLLYLRPTFSFRKENTQKYCFQDVQLGSGAQCATCDKVHDP
jgi:hypothetical protein